MLTEITAIAAATPPRPAATVPAQQPRPLPGEGAAVAPVASERLTRQAVEPSQALDRASRAAARALFQDRDVEVTSFQDEGTGRVVYRVADRKSGEVLHQSPPDALLRFYASSREGRDRPLVAVEA